jgi:universal stress protein E
MKRFKNILYVNEPADQESAIARAVSLAVNNQADLTVVDVIPTQVVTAGIGLPPGGPISNDLRAAVESDRRKAMESMVQSFKERLQSGWKYWLERRTLRRFEPY